VEKLELEVINITQGFTQHNSYAVVLGELKGNRRLPIVIGASEAQAIAVAFENMPPARPLTHDLFKTVLDTFEISLKEVVITNLLDGIFYSKLICEQHGETYEIDSRTSDAIALALRFACPIYIYGNILESAGIVLMEESESMVPSTPEEAHKEITRTDYSVYTLKELEKMLEEAITGEDYEKAAKIRDEMGKRKK
jgi:bifunctional DNase/RNase